VEAIPIRIMSSKIHKPFYIHTHIINSESMIVFEGTMGRWERKRG
jgi:hypothetical protein